MQFHITYFIYYFSHIFLLSTQRGIVYNFSCTSCIRFTSVCCSIDEVVRAHCNNLTWLGSRDLLFPPGRLSLTTSLSHVRILWTVYQLVRRKHSIMMYPFLADQSVTVKWLAVKTASEMTYTVSGGTLNSTQSYSILADRTAADWLLAWYCSLSVRPSVCLSVSKCIVALGVGVGVESCTVVFLKGTSYSLLYTLML